MDVVWVKRWKVLYKDRGIKSCLESRDKTPGDSRRPVPGYRSVLGVQQIEQQLTRPMLHSLPIHAQANQKPSWSTWTGGNKDDIRYA